jgi:hypothetical protein
MHFEAGVPSRICSDTLSSLPTQGGVIVSYVLFCTDDPTPPQRMPGHFRTVSVESDSVGAAINAACRLIADGVIVWKLKGSEGFTMERSDIEIEHSRRQEMSRHLKTGQINGQPAARRSGKRQTGLC